MSFLFFGFSFDGFGYEFFSVLWGKGDHLHSFSQLKAASNNRIFGRSPQAAKSEKILPFCRHKCVSTSFLPLPV